MRISNRRGPAAAGEVSPDQARQQGTTRLVVQASRNQGGEPQARVGGDGVNWTTSTGYLSQRLWEASSIMATK